MATESVSAHGILETPRSRRDLLKKVRKIEITTNRAVNDHLAGNYHSVFRGRGMEFDEVRAYVDGDDIRFIDWNVSARTGHLFVKRFVEERQLTVLALVDASASQVFGSKVTAKSEVAAELTALIAFSAIKNNDRVGVAMFTDRVEHYVPAKKGKNHVLRVISECLEFKPQGRRTRIAEALTFLVKVHKRAAVVFLISDFHDTGWEQALQVASRKHDIIPVLLRDPAEESLPDAGMVTARDAETGALIYIDTADAAVRKAYAQAAAGQRERTLEIFRKLGLDVITLHTHENYVRPLVKFFQMRARRMRS